jgi:hypothetical protein
MNETIKFEDDLRYIKAKLGIESGKILSLEDLLKVVPKTVIAKQLKINPVRFSDRVANPRLFHVGELQDLAKQLNVDFIKLMSIIFPADNRNLKEHHP